MGVNDKFLRKEAARSLEATEDAILNSEEYKSISNKIKTAENEGLYQVIRFNNHEGIFHYLKKEGYTISTKRHRIADKNVYVISRNNA